MRSNAWLALLTLGQVLTCVQDLLYSPTRASPLDFSITPLAETLEQAICSQVQVHFLASYNVQVRLTTLGQFEVISLLCEGNALLVTQALCVQMGSVAIFNECRLESDFEDAMLKVEGRVELESCEVRNLKGRGFDLRGEMSVNNSTFQANKQSLFYSTTFGFALSVSTSRFQGNTSPQGTILYLQPSGTQSNSTTVISFKQCEFRENTAGIVGSFMYVIVGRSNLTSSQLLESRTLSITNSIFANSPGYLWYLQLRHLNASFHNNTIQYAENPIFLALFDNSFGLFNTTIQHTSRPFFCSYVGGLVLIDGIQIEGVSNGPALMVLNQAPFGLGQVVMRNVDLAMVNQVDFSWFVSTIYSLAVPITVNNVLIHSGFSFAAACGAYFFSVSAVDHCTVTNTTVVQGGLIGHVFGQGTASNLNMTDTNSTLGGCFLILGANIAFRNLTLVISEGYSMPTLTGMYAFHDGNASLTDAYAIIPRADNQYLIEADNEELYLARLYWNKVEGVTLLKISRSQVVAEEFSADTVDLAYFASVITGSSLELRNIHLENPNLSGGFISATTLCNITAANISVNGGYVGIFASSFHSFVQIAHIQLLSIHSDVLFVAYLSSVLTVSNLTLQQSTGDLVSSVHSSVLISEMVLTDITSDRGLLRLRFSEMTWRSVHMTGFKGTAISPLCSSLSSNLTIYNSHLLSLLSREQGLCHFIDSSMALEFTSIHFFNVTLLQLHRTHFTILNSTISTGGLRLMSEGAKVKASAGFMDASDSKGIIRGSSFKEISGVNGGCFALTSTGVRASQISVSGSVFEHCWAEEKGGVIYAAGSSIKIEETEMKNNEGRDGGCFYFECETSEACSFQMRHANSTRNSATNGGVVKWTKVRPQMINITSEGNTAEYGDVEASLPTHTVLLNSDSQLMEGVPGVVVVEPILIGFLDAVGQLVKTDNQSSAELLSGSLVGTTYVIAKNGIANFSGVIVQTHPGTSVHIDVYSQSISRVFPGSPAARSFVIYDTRDCIPGEVTSATGCFICPTLSFSVNPIEGECRACPNYATCPGGMCLHLDAGYWRSSELSSEVFLCPIQNSCLGGQNSTCAQGYSDKQCAKCVSRYYIVGFSACIECEGFSIMIIRSVLLIAFLLLLYICILWKMPLNIANNQSSIILPSLKVAIDYLQALMIISIITIDWGSSLTRLFSTIEMILSLGLSTFLVECYWGKMYSDGEVPPVYVKAALAIGFPIGLLLLNWSCFLLFHCLTHIKYLTRRGWQSSLMLTCILTPYVVKTCLQLVSCRKVEGESYWLNADVAIECWTAPHYKYVIVLFLPACVIYIIGVPVLFSVLLIKFQASPYQCILIPIISGYKVRCRYWAVLALIRKLLLLLMLTLLASPIWLIPNLLSTALLFFNLDWHMRISPFDESFYNKSETCSLIVQMILICSSFFLQADIKVKSHIQTVIWISELVLLLLLLSLYIAALLTRLLRATRTQPQELQLSQGNHSAFKPPPPSIASVEESGGSEIQALEPSMEAL